jgi:outer membrane lipoprotein-sorting protein
MMTEDTDRNDIDAVLEDAFGGEPSREVAQRLRERLSDFHRQLADGEALPSHPNRALRWMMVPIPAAAVALLAVLLLTRSSGPTFAEVVSNLRGAQTMTCQMRISGKVNGTGYEMTSDYKFMEPGGFRMEGPGGMIMVFDQKKGEYLQLMPGMKTALLVEFQGTGRGPNAGVGFIEGLRRLEGANAEDLGRRTIDGREAVGFRTVGSAGPAGSEQATTMEFTIWADVRTGLPVEVDIDSTVNGVKGHAVMGDFVFDPQLDPSLFSLEPPAGYRLQHVTMPGSAPTQEDFLAGLRLYAKMMDGRFPGDMKRNMSAADLGALSGQIAGAFAKTIALASGGHPTPEQMAKMVEQASALQRAFQFVSVLPADSGWHYSGERVRLGDADKPLCWWRPAGSKTYTVVYGDLSAREVPPEALPAP